MPIDTKIRIALGAVAPDNVTALIVTRGLGAELPTVRACSRRGLTAPSLLIPKPLPPGEDIAGALRERDVRVYRVKARLPPGDEVVIEAANAAGTVHCASAPVQPLPTKLADSPGGFTIALATCLYYWPAYLHCLAATLRGIQGLASAPRFVLLAGDNVYLDVPKPRGQMPADVVDRYLNYFFDDAYMNARASLPAFSTYDDHEYWNDYPELSKPVDLWLSERERPGFAAAAEQCLQLFQRSINPPPVERARFAYRIDIAPLSLFVIDTRTERDRVDHPRGQLMPEEDLQALEAWAHGLTGPGVLVVGQPLWIEPTMKTLGFVGDHNVSYFRRQYERICRALEQAPYDVLICSGDVHYSRLLRIETRSRRVLHEVVSSPLVSIPTTWASVADYLPGNGSAAPQGASKIDDTRTPPYPGWHASYQMGTGNGTVLALLNFKPAGACVSVGLSFIDIVKRAPAELVPETTLGTAQLFPQASAATRCTHPEAFQLGKRLV